MPQLTEVPFEGVPGAVVDQAQPGGFYVVSQPIAEEPATPLSFLGGLAGGIAAGAALVYSLFQRIGQKVSVQAKNLELGARATVDVESPSVALAEVVESTALAPYLAGGASLPAVLKQVTSGRTAMPAFGRPLGAINIGQGRRVVINMMAKDEFCYGLPGGDNILGNFDPAGFLKG